MGEQAQDAPANAYRIEEQMIADMFDQCKVNCKKVNFRTPSINNKSLACLVERVGREDCAELLDAVEEEPLHLAGPVDVVLGRRRRLHLLLRVHGVDHVVGRVDQRLRNWGQL